MTYNDCHRKFLQAIIQRGVISDDEARQLIIKIFRSNDRILSIASEINEGLKPLNMMIKDASCELTGQKYYMFVSNTLDETLRFQTKYKPAQLELVRKVFSEIVTSADGYAQSTMCLNLCSTLENKMSKADAEDFLKDMVKEKWLVDQGGKFFMGVRSVSELMPYFKTTYEEDVFNTCSLCRQVVFHGERCTQCLDVMHLFCLANFATVQNPLKCPKCKNLLTPEYLPDLDATAMRNSLSQQN